MGSGVRHLQKATIADGADLLVRAFAADPILTHLLRSSADGDGHPAFFRSVIREHISGGHVYAAWDGRDLLGVAIWVAPGVVHRSTALGRAAADDIGLLDRLYPQGVRDLATAFGELGELHPPGPHWYLAFVGVEPRRQGQGVGRGLLEPVLHLADDDGSACYLETPSAATIPFYRGSGFEIEAEVRPFPGLDLPVWTMLRRPNAPDLGR